MLEESKTKELQAMQEKMKMLKEKQQAKEAEISEIETRLIDKEKAKQEDHAKLQMQLRQVSTE